MYLLYSLLNHHPKLLAHREDDDGVLSVQERQIDGQMDDPADGLIQAISGCLQDRFRL